MDLEKLALEHQETKDRSLRNEGRIKKIEDEHVVLHKLATSVEVMALQIQTMNSSISALKGDVEDLKEKPGKRWDSLVEKIILTIAGAMLGFILSQIGL